MEITGKDLPPPISQRIRDGVVEGWRTVFKMIKFVLPLYIIVDLSKTYGLLDSLGTWCAPFMGLFGLPGATAFAFIAGALVNLYAAIAVLAPLDLTPWQVTQCGVMMGIAHNLVVEGGVLSSTGARGGVLTLCRILLAALAGWLMMALQALGVAG
ncbi:MAG: nucleoside recognition domain-containing protein [Desulfuromonadales bacterium]